MNRRGSALVWMLMVALVVLAAGLGAAGMGSASGDYVRRQVTADAAARSAAEVFAERLRHIDRLRELGGGAEAARMIARRTAGVVRAEAERVARGNGAARVDVRVPRDWFVETDAGIEPAPGFESKRLEVVVWQQGADGVERRAESAAWPAKEPDWAGRLVP